jgi:nucleotide-binding universal stress UspA family protein
MDTANRETAKLLVPAEKELDKAGLRYTKEVLCGSAASLIAERAKPEEFAGIVMGTRGMGAVKGLLVGSVAHQVVHLAHVPVTLVK